MSEGFEDRFLGDFVKNQTTDGDFRLENFLQMPADCLPFTVFVRRQKEFARVLQQVLHQLGVQVDEHGHRDAFSRHGVDHELDGVLVVEQHQGVFVEGAGLFPELKEFPGVEQALVVGRHAMSKLYR